MPILRKFGEFLVLLCLLFWSGAAPASAATSGPISFENVDIQTVVKQVAALTGITFSSTRSKSGGRSHCFRQKASLRRRRSIS